MEINKRTVANDNTQDVIPYGRQFIDSDDIKAVVAVLKSDFITQGPKVEEFEVKFAKTVNARYAVAFSTGTSALYAAVNALQLPEKSRILTTPMTFAASTNSIVTNRHIPVFKDIELATGNMNLSYVENFVKNNNIKAALLVDFAGQPCDIDVVKKLNIPVITDACHSLGSLYKEKSTGSIADMTVFSFHPVKHITTGEGGMVTTNSLKYLERLRKFRSHGIIKNKEQFKNKPIYGDSFATHYYEMQELTENYRITDIQCALGISQLSKLNKFVEKRRKLAKNYFKLFEKLSDFVFLPYEKDYVKHSYHLFFIHVKKKPFGIIRDKLYEFLKDKNIHCQVHYLPVHLHPYYRKKFKFKLGDFPVSEEFYEKTLSIPLYYSLTFSQQQTVVKEIQSFFAGGHYAD
jgi:UDP-4-amino-4,6-dideoxy-N-acetyl-beta-L-altrosamine transaminase